MSSPEVDCWFELGKNVVLYKLSLKPIEHPIRKGKPLSSQKGQAEAFFLIDDHGQRWILKKFHNGCNLDLRYLKKIVQILPKDEGFACGTERRIVENGTLEKIPGFHFSKELDHWLDGTILMPCIGGYDWAGLADELREGKVRLDLSQRFMLAQKLTKLIEVLEQYQCCHRDLSCGNVFIDLNLWRVSLIDFDSIYHPILKMPKMTTCGTAGYTCHLAWNGTNLDPKSTWCQYSDRYALALIIIELLLVDPGFKMTGEGGIFDQEELRNQSGNGINSILSCLNTNYSQAAQLLEATIKCRNFSDCPSPQDWDDFFKSVPGLSPPSLNDFQVFSGDSLTERLTLAHAAAPLWPAPSLSDFKEFNIKIPSPQEFNFPEIELPPDPWSQH